MHSRTTFNFIDDLIEREERYIHAISQIKVCPSSALQQEFSLYLPPIFLIRFDFFTRARRNWTFHDNIRMIRLLSVLDGEGKGNVESISCNKLFYATTYPSYQEKNFEQQ